MHRNGNQPANNSDIAKAVAAISSEWWGVRGGAPSGVQGHSRPEAEKKLNFDNTKPL